MKIAVVPVKFTAFCVTGFFCYSYTITDGSFSARKVMHMRLMKTMTRVEVSVRSRELDYILHRGLLWLLIYDNGRQFLCSESNAHEMDIRDYICV